MGLDNGIVVKCKKKILCPKDIQMLKTMATHTFTWYYKEETDDLSVEICYWRKFWGFRDIIIDDILGWDYDETEAQLTVPQMEDIISLLEDMTDKKFFDEHGESVWDFEEQLPWFQRQIENLKYVIDMKGIYGDDISVIFYDSY